MATSPIYSWPEPDNTDLVKNGALAIRTLGNAIDTTMGTMVAKTIIDAKGDLIAGTAADTAARLAVGNNGETLVADSSASTGLRYQSAYNGNAIINGGMDIWQRGTTMTAGGQQYKTADRYYLNNNNNPNFTFNQVASGFDSIRYAARIQRASGSTSTTVCAIGYTLETNDSVRFQGKTVTFSYYVKKGSNFSGADFNGALYYGTGTDQQLYSFTGLTIIGSAFSISPTTSWVRYSYTATVPTTATEIGFQLQFTPTGTAGTNDFIDITGIQLEEGSVATTFKRAGGGTIQGELAACQRYYERMIPNGQNISFAGFNNSTTVGYFTIPFKVRKRVNPTMTLGSVATDWAVRIPGGTNQQLSAYSVIGNTLENAWLSGTATGLTSGNGNLVVNVGDNGYIEASSEL